MHTGKTGEAVRRLECPATALPGEGYGLWE